MKKTWLTLLVVLIFLGFLALALGLAVRSQRPDAIQRRAILELELDRAYLEYLPYQSFTSGLFDVTPTLSSVVEALDRAAADERIVAVVAKVGTAPMGLAGIQELRDAVIRFRESGKPAIAYADTFGEWRAANSAYYLATAFERIYLQPSGDVSLTGLLYETPFYRGLFEKLDITPRFGRRHEYKNAADSYTETSYTPAHREALQALADSQFEQILRGIAQSRGLAAGEARRISDRSPLLGREALQAGLVDELAYRDAAYAALEERFPEAGVVTQSRYIRQERQVAWSPIRGGRRKVALIYGVGDVVRGEGGYDPLFGSQALGSDTVGQAFRDAVADRDVAAIVFRVSSPGGSYVASDTIWREVVRAREAGKPVIVSMGDVAASGGYFIAMAADAIVAHPGTITGSIGVYGGKLISRGMWAKAGISWDDVATSEMARIWSGNHDFDAGEWSRIEDSLDRIYEDFTAKVAEGRAMTPAEVHEVARGRVWTGEDALARGLVDELGGYEVAMRRAREAIGVDPDAELEVELFPRPKSPFELLGEGRWIGGAPSASVERLARVARSVAVAARELGLLDAPAGPLTLWPPRLASGGR